MKTALIVGNGLTISLRHYLGLQLDSSNPLRWNVHTPGRDSLLIDDLPHLKQYIEENNGNGDLTDFELFLKLVGSQQNSDSPVPNGNDLEQAAILDAGHFLAVAYSWFQLELDNHVLDGWEWADWILENVNTLVASFSWNYDLVLERLIERAQSPYFYPGISTCSEAAGIKYNRIAIPVCKPHGSCNFAPKYLSMGAVSKDGEEFTPLTYPRTIHVTACDGPMKNLPRDQIYSIRETADVVLPGEWNRFGQHLGWVRNSLDVFAIEAGCKAEQLLIVGFSMMECDREEFLYAIRQMSSLRRITIVDPSPNPELIEVLKGKAPEIHLCKTWPDPSPQIIKM